MAFMSSMNVVGSALTAEMLRLDVISENITNINTTRTEGGGPYRRKVVVLEEQGERTPFQLALARAGSAAAPAQAQYIAHGSQSAARHIRTQTRRSLNGCGLVRLAAQAVPSLSSISYRTLRRGYQKLDYQYRT